MSESRADTVGRDLCKWRWVCYAPTIFRPDPNNAIPVSQEVLRGDLQSIRPYWNGLILYGSD